MINQGKCPHCGKTMLHARVEKVGGMVDDESKARCLSFSCIHCNAVLGIQLDARARRRPKSTASKANA
jgi:hypothetical protein